jgi:hypothetical protein
MSGFERFFHGAGQRSSIRNIRSLAISCFIGIVAGRHAPDTAEIEDLPGVGDRSESDLIALYYPTVITPDIFNSQFAWGFYLGLFLCFLALYNYFRLKGEMGRFRRHLSDKLEIEAETMKKIKGDQENLRRENESLRIKVNALNELPDRKMSRDLEVYARAEKKMLVQVPGFAPAWETAKSEAHTELVEEETGRSAPRRIFSRLFGGGGANALPGRSEESKHHPDIGDGTNSKPQTTTITTEPAEKL